MADGSIRVETKLDTKGVEKGLEDIDKMCNDTKKHLEDIAVSLNVKTNPVEIVSNAELNKAKKKLDEINAQIERIRSETDKLLPTATTDEQAVNLLKMEEEETRKLVAEQENLNRAISDYEAKQAKIAAEKQQSGEIKTINTDVSGNASANNFVSKIKNADDYKSKLEQVKNRMLKIEQETAKLAAEKGIDSTEALKANKEYQKLNKQYKALVDNADRFKRSSKGGFDAARDGAKSLGSSMKGIIKTMSKYTLAIFGARSAFFAVKNAIRQVLADNEQLNNTVTAMKGVFANALAPVIERVVYWLKYAFAYLNLFIKVLTGVDMVADYNAKALNKQAEATAKTAKATKEANNQLAAFDEKNMLNDNTSNTAEDTSASSSAALLELPDVSGGKFEQICETIKAHINELETILGVALIATGFILLAVGQIPMGIACIIAGITVMAAAISDWGSLSSQVQNMITTIMSIAGGAFLVIGMILIATGVKMGLGVAMIAVGAALLVTSEKLNWNTMSDKMKSVITEIDIIVGSAFLVLGAILAFSGANVALGVALIAVGAVALVTAALLNWNELSDQMKITILAIAAVVSIALLVIGSVIAFSGANLALGIALMAAGAVGLATSITLLWNALPDKVKNTISIITAIVSVALLVLGIVLCATGVALPLGVALIAAGAVGLVTVAALNKDAIANWISEAWAKVKNFWNNSIKPIFTKEWWKKKFDTIKQGMKDALNGVIDIIERTINSVVSKLNSFRISIPDWVPKYGGASLGFNIPYAHIPRLAKGGIVNNPGKGRIVTVGEAGAEAILPLQNNTEWMDVLVDKVAEAVSMNVMNKIYLDGKEIHSSNRKYSSRFEFATNGGVL